MKLTNAYNAGWRAGKAPAKVVEAPNGLKHLDRPLCPLVGMFSRMAWEAGYHEGVWVRLTTNH